MTIPLLTTANTFSEWLNDTQQLIVLMNSLTDGPQFNANSILVLTLNATGSNLSSLNVAGLINQTGTGQIVGLQANGDITAGAAGNTLNALRLGTWPSAPGYRGLLLQSHSGNEFLLLTHANVQLDSATYLSGRVGATIYVRANSNDPINQIAVPPIATGWPYVGTLANTILHLGNIPYGNTTNAGLLQLNDTVSSTNTAQAATANAAKTASDKAVTALALATSANSLATSAAANANLQPVMFQNVYVTSRAAVNFLQGTGIAISVIDDPANNAANVTINANAAVLGTMSSQNANNVNISGGAIVSTRVDASRITEGLNTYTPLLNANVMVDWGTGGGSIITTNGVNQVFFTNIASGVMGHTLQTSNLVATTFAANANVDFGVGGKPVVAGKSIVTLASLNAGVNVLASLYWRAV